VQVQTVNTTASATHSRQDELNSTAVSIRAPQPCSQPPSWRWRAWPITRRVTGSTWCSQFSSVQFADFQCEHCHWDTGVENWRWVHFVCCEHGLTGHQTRKVLTRGRTDHFEFSIKVCFQSSKSNRFHQFIIVYLYPKGSDFLWTSTLSYELDPVMVKMSNEMTCHVKHIWIFIHRETVAKQKKHSNTSINTNETKAATKSVIRNDALAEV